MRAFPPAPCGRRGGNRPAPPWGCGGEDRYLMLGEPDVPAAPGDRVVGGSGYEVRTAHPIYLGERLSHWWAVLAPLGQGGDMSGGLEQIREGLTAHLNGKGIRAVPAWSRTARTFPCGAGGRSIPAGVPLGPGRLSRLSGERYDPEAGRWEELYGRRVKLTFGLDLYGERAQGDEALQAAFDSWRGRSIREGPRGCGCWSSPAGRRSMTREGQLLRRPVEAVYEACLYAAAEPGGLFPGL